MALEIGRYTVAIQQANGTTVAERGKYVQAWRRLGIWLMTANCWNSDLPAGEIGPAGVAGAPSPARTSKR